MEQTAITPKHVPDVVTQTDAVGRWFSHCLRCGERSKPSSHKPIAEEWRRTHITNNTRRPLPKETR